MDRFAPKNTKQDTYPLPLHSNFDFMCLVSAHAQTLNEYSKKHIWMFSSQILDNRVSITALKIINLLRPSSTTIF